MKIKHNIIAHIVAIGLLAVVPSIESPAQTTWKFIFTSDSRGYTGGINLTILKELVSEIRNHNVDFGLLAGDLNGDCYVDFLDIALLIEDWLKCGNPFDPACRLQQ